MRPTLGFIGAGRVGGTLARLLAQAGYTISTVYSHTPADARALAQDVGAQAMTTAQAVIPHADLVFLTVPDDQIAPLAATLVKADWQGRSAVHTSGASSVDLLQSMADVGAHTGSLHPAFPFASDQPLATGLRDVTFAIEADHVALKHHLEQVVSALAGHVLHIPAGQKARYHAALVIASNYTVTLYALAQRLLTDLGADTVSATAALDALLTATTANLADKGIPDALTGPLTRADTGTISAHLDALADDPALRDLYRALARATLPLVHQRGVVTDDIDQLIEDDS